MSKVNTTQNAGNLDAHQLELLDTFLAAAVALNESGVSLLWDEDNNCLCAANRDVMKDCSFFRDEFDQERPEGSVLLSDTATNGLDIEITPISRDYDLYYFPKED